MVVDHRNVGAAFRRLSIPVAVAMLGDQLLGIADTIAIGSLGVVALAGATAANTMFLALNMANAGFLSGTSIVAAQRVGAQDMEGFGRTVRSGAVAPLVAGLLFFIGAWFWGGIAIHATVGDLASGPASAAYLTVRCLSILPIMVSGSLIVGLGQAGNQKLGIWVLIAINLVHIPLLLMLALGWWTHHPMGILGAGISSFLSETAGMIFAIVYVARRPAYRIFSKLTISLKVAWQTALLGMPEAVFLFTVMLPDIFIVAMLAPFGATAVAAFRALNVVSRSHVRHSKPAAERGANGDRPTPRCGRRRGRAGLFRARAACDAADHGNRRRGGRRTARGRLRLPSRSTRPSHRSPHYRSRCT